MPRKARLLRVAAVIPAGGSGRRMAGAGGRPKQYELLGGEPILRRAVRPFLDHPAVEWVIVVLPPDDVAEPPIPFPAEVVLVAGGAERGDSVRNGLAAVPAEADVVVIHDGARPLLTVEVLERTLDAVTEDRGAVAAIPVTDTLKRVDAERRVLGTVERDRLWRAQTPQAFPRTMLADAYRRAREEGVSATDDAALVERYGGRVVLVEGDSRNLKVTRPEDLALAELLLSTARSEGA